MEKQNVIGIYNGLYQGPSYAVLDGQYLRLAKAVICVNENNERYFPKYGEAVAHLWCGFNDPGEDLTIEKLKAIADFYHTFLHSGTFVHCMAATNRSSLICAWILSEVEHYDVEGALWRVKKQNPNARIREELLQKMVELTGNEDWLSCDYKCRL